MNDFAYYMKRLSQCEKEVIKGVIGFICFALLIAIILFAGTGCAYKGSSSVNFALINSRSPAINAVGTNDIQAATGFTGGGKLDATVPVSAIP